MAQKSFTIDLNEQFLHALDVMENTQKNVFITGRAGTGKSTLLDYFRTHTKKKAVVLAPTGVAAVNVRGQTIHSFFKFKPDVTLQSIKLRKKKEDVKKNIYQKLDTIVIDEVSMVRADLLDCVDKFMRVNGRDATKTFGGTQMIFIGDLYQLPPVVTSQEKEIFRSHYHTPYFFSARVFENFDMEFIELEKIYRQQDEHFINLLNAIRNNSVNDKDLAALNQRYDPEFEPSLDDFYVYLTPLNAQAEAINEKQLAQHKAKLHTFRGITRGEFGREYLPTAIDLQVKSGAQIMMLNNDSSNRWINGTIGKIETIEEDEAGEPVIVAELDNGRSVDIYPYTWEIFKFYLEEGQLKSEVIGSFTQFPLMLAWAVTIHKSQGKTFERVIIDLGRGTFAHGQLYVALSRCTTLNGMVLKKPVHKKHVWMDYHVVNYLTKYQYHKAEQRCSVDDKMEIIRRAIKDKKALTIVYLKPNDEKSRRTIKPKKVGEMEYQGRAYLGLEAFCMKRQDTRVFRVDRILEIQLET